MVYEEDKRERDVEARVPSIPLLPLELAPVRAEALARLRERLARRLAQIQQGQQTQGTPNA